jgi:hypothetical protein
MKPLAVLTLAAGALLAAPAAQAQPQATVVKIHDVVFTGPTAECLDVAEFPLGSPSGAVIGSGTACLTGGDFGCFPVPVPGCAQTTLSTFTFRLPGGTVEADMTLKEVFTSESSLVQVGRGEIIGGGRIVGGGTATFTATGIAADLTYVVLQR